MKNKIETIVESLLIKEFQPMVEMVLKETEITQFNVPDITTAASPAAMSLRPNSGQLTNSPKLLKKLFKVISTTPLVYNLIQLGLLDSQGIVNDLDDSEDEQNNKETESNTKVGTQKK